MQKRRFLRAGAMNSLTRAGVRAIRDLGVSRIVDLRSSYERQRMPDTLEEDARIDFIHVPMLDYIQSNMAKGEIVFPASMEEMYVELLDNAQDSFRRVLEACGDPEHRTVLFHCTAGKDRTGLTAMLLLGAAGVCREDIVEDYSHSERLLPASAIHPGLPHYVFESRALTMETALDHLDAKYGGIAGYLRTIGLSPSVVEALEKKLLED